MILWKQEVKKEQDW